MLEVLRQAVRGREPIVDQYYTPTVKDFLTFHRVTLPLWEDRQGVWQVIQGLQPVPEKGINSGAITRRGLFPKRRFPIIGRSSAMQLSGFRAYKPNISITIYEGVCS